MIILKGKTITDVPGFKACGVHSGIKKNKYDLCVISSDVPATSAGVFTKNKVQAAPVVLDIENIKQEKSQAIVVNSGNANACTGSLGLENAKKMAEKTASCLGIDEKSVLVSSTGIIGVQLPIETVLSGIEKACDGLSTSGGAESAKAIVTTDSYTKEIALQLEIDGKDVFIGGMAKGSGMIHPNMGTMLSFITTNLNIEKSALSKMLKESVEDSYNMISVDGDTSTNDSVIILANGLAQNHIISSEGEDYTKFKEALDYVNTELAKMIAADGEGSTKLIESHVINAPSKEEAKLCAKSVISSSLVKAAFFGNNTNWGRILCAIGYSGADINPDIVDVYFKSDSECIQIVENGIGINFDEEKAQKIMEGGHVNITIDLKTADYSATAWGCDLSYDYIKVNAMYKS